MAITRIKNNQIFDSTIVASAKLVDRSVSGLKLAEDLVYDSDLTVTGNLVVQGSTTTIDTTNTTIEDPIMVLSSTGAASGVDVGFVGVRALPDDNIAFVWDASANEFKLAYTTSDGGTATVENSAAGYANLHLKNLALESLTGTINFPGLDTDAVLFIDAAGNLSTDTTFAYDTATGALDLAGSLKVDNVTIDGDAITSLSGLSVTAAADSDINLAVSGTGTVSASNLVVEDLDPSRVVFTDANNQLVIDANLAFNGSQLDLVGDLSVTGTSELADITVTTGQIQSALSLAVVSTGNLVLDPSENVIVDTATATHVFYAGTNKELLGSANFTFDGSNVVVTGSAKVDNVTVDGSAIASTASLSLTAALDQNIVLDVSGLGSVAIDDLAVKGTTISSAAGDIIIDAFGNISAAGSVITNVADPVTAQDAATKAYVDSVAGDVTTISQDNSSVVVADDGQAPGTVVTTVDGTAVVTTTLAGTTFAHDVAIEDITIAGSTITATTGDLVLASTSGAVEVAGATQYEVFVAGVEGALEGSAGLTYNGALLNVTGNVTASGDITGAKLTVDNVVIDTDSITGASNTTISAAGNLTLDTTGDVIVNNATAGQIFVAGANKELEGSVALTYDGANLAVTGNVAATGSLTGTALYTTNIDVVGNAVVSDTVLNVQSGANGNINITPDGSGVTNIANLVIANQLPYHVIFTDVDGKLTTDGNLQFDGDDFTITGSLAVDDIKFDANTINSIATNSSIRIEPNGTGEFYVDRNMVVSGNLSVLGTTTTVDSTVVTIQDPIIELGRGAGNTPLTAPDGKDRGVRLWYWDSTSNEEQSAWMGYDHPTEEFRYFNDAVITDEEVSGVLGTINVGKVIVDTITLDQSSITATGQLQIISGLDSDLTLTANGAGKVVVPTGDQLQVTDLDTNRVVWTTTGGELISSAALGFDGTTLAVTGAVTVDDVTIDGNTVSSATALNLSSGIGEDINIAPGAGGTTNITGLTIAGVTANRVVVSDGDGGLTSDADFTYNSTTNALVLTGSAKVDNVTIDAGTIAVDTDAVVSAVGNITLDPTANVIVDTATAGQVFFSGANKELIGSGNFTFDGTAAAIQGSFAVDNVAIDGSVVSSLNSLDIVSAANGNINITPDGTGVVNITNLVIDNLQADRVVVTNTDGALVEVDTFTFDTTTSALELTGSAKIDNVTIDGTSIASDNALVVSSAADITLTPVDNVIVSNATPTQIFVAGPNSELLGTADLTFGAGNLSVTGNVAATGDVSGASLNIDNVTIDGNAIVSDDALNIQSGNDGNINITPNGNGVVNIDSLVIAGLAVNSVVVTDANGAASTSTNLTFNGTDLVATADVTVTGSVAVDNITVDGDSITGANGLDVTATTGNITLTPTAGDVIVSNATATQVFYAGANNELVGDANLTWASNELTVTGDATVTGVSTLGNVVVSGDDITTAGTMLTVNAAGADVDFRVSSDTKAAAVFVDGATGSVVLGSDVVTADVALKIAATNAMIIPTGLNTERPTVPVVGMLRFNTNIGDMEVYDGDSWNATSTEFTLIASETFNGDGTTATFTLNSEQTTASCIVSINGVIQFPTLAYAVSGTSLSFTEAPEVGDVIEVRKLTTTKSFALEVVNTAETARLSASESAAQIDVMGNVVPTANEVYDLGSASFRWRDLYLAGTTIDLGGVKLQNTAGTFTVVDGSNNKVNVDVDVDGGTY